MFVFGCRTQSAPVELTCVFVDTTIVLSYGYTCVLNLKTFNDPSYNVIFTGQHRGGRNNSDVRNVRITNSKVPFIIRDIFTVFPNIYAMQVDNGGLNEIQGSAFERAVNLRVLNFVNNNITSLRADTFINLPFLEELNFVSNNILNISVNAFIGLQNLMSLKFQNDSISTFMPFTFRPLNNLRNIFLTGLSIQRIDGRLFASNRLLRILDLQDNAIDAIQSTFLNNLANIQIINLMENQCVNYFFSIEGNLTIPDVQRNLTTCFNNFNNERPTNVTRLILEVEGHLTLFNENGTAIVRI